jgi:hypothetical protein
MRDAIIHIAFVAARYSIPDRSCDRRLMIHEHGVAGVV